MKKSLLLPWFSPNPALSLQVFLVAAVVAAMSFNELSFELADSCACPAFVLLLAPISEATRDEKL